MRRKANTDFAVKQRLIEMGKIDLEDLGDEFKIRDGIPMPERNKTRQSKYQMAAKKMKVGDAVFYKSIQKAAYFRLCLIRINKNGAVRKIIEGEFKGQFGVWRTE